MGTILARYITGLVCLYVILVLTSLWNYCQYNQRPQLLPLCALLCLVAQSCLTLCAPRTAGPQAPLSMGILQARMLEWVAMTSSRGSSQPRDATQVSHIAGGFFTV